MTGTNTKYSLSWAQSVVQRLSEAHARATEILLKELHIGTYQLAYYLAMGRKEYYLIREMIRKLDRLIEIPRKDGTVPPIPQYTTWALSRLEAEAVHIGLNSFADYLTALRNGREAIEASQEGVP